MRVSSVLGVVYKTTGGRLWNKPWVSRWAICRQQISGVNLMPYNKTANCTTLPPMIGKDALHRDSHR